ncbi:MAG: TLD domain-containing protein [archaeon]|nr:TLD domain-containing protein [archaeon]
MEAKKEDSNEAEIPKDFAAPLPAKEDIKNLLCPECKSSLEIKAIELEDMKYIITYTCQNNHTKEKVPLHEFIKSQEGLEPKEIFTCKLHSGAAMSAYCNKCEVEICPNCSFEEIHDDHKEALAIYSSMIPKKSEIKEFVQSKIKEHGILDKNKWAILSWLDELKLKIAQNIEDQKQLVLMQQGFVNNINPLQLNMCKIKSLNYLMGNKAGIIDDCISQEKFTNAEEKLMDVLGLRMESFSSTDYSKVSKIVTNKEDWRTILGFFDKKPKRLTKLYSAKEDGDKARNFHNKCDGQGPTLTIIKSDTGFTFGGYTSLSWESEDNNDYEDLNAFLFSLDYKKKYPAGKKDGIKKNSDYGATFSTTSNGYSIIRIKDNCRNNDNFTWCDDYYGNPKLQKSTKAEAEDFKVDDYETYKVEI